MSTSSRFQFEEEMIKFAYLVFWSTVAGLGYFFFLVGYYEKGPQRFFRFSSVEQRPKVLPISNLARYKVTTWQNLSLTLTQT